VDQASRRGRELATTLCQKEPAKVAKGRRQRLRRAPSQNAQWTELGRHGVSSQYAREHAGVDLRSECVHVTVPRWQTEEKNALGQHSRHANAVTHLALLMEVGMIGLTGKYALSHVEEEPSSEPGRAQVPHLNTVVKNALVQHQMTKLVDQIHVQSTANGTSGDHMEPAQRHADREPRHEADPTHQPSSEAKLVLDPRLAADPVRTRNAQSTANGTSGDHTDRAQRHADRERRHEAEPTHQPSSEAKLVLDPRLAADPVRTRNAQSTANGTSGDHTEPAQRHADREPRHEADPTHQPNSEAKLVLDPRLAANHARSRNAPSMEAGATGPVSAHVTRIAEPAGRPGHEHVPIPRPNLVGRTVVL